MGQEKENKNKAYKDGSAETESGRICVTGEIPKKDSKEDANTNKNTNKNMNKNTNKNTIKKNDFICRESDGAHKQKKTKSSWKNYIGVVLFMLIGAVCGVVMVRYTEQGGKEMPAGRMLYQLSALILVMYFAMLVQIILHEAGHLVCGLLTGYRFCSFRIMGILWIKENGKIKRKKLNIAGTGGQCLMAPPPYHDGNFPAVLYNFGGPVMNAAAGALFAALYVMFPGRRFVSALLLLFAVIGFAFALMNGIPLRIGTVDNDGYNALSLSRSKQARFAFWMQMKVNELNAKGVRLKDMPKEWFAVPSDEEMKNSMTAVRGVYACSRLMDAGRFEEADRLMAHFLQIESGIVDLHRAMMVCERMYLEMIGENRLHVLEGMYTKEQKKFMKAMRQYPSVLRTEYTYDLFVRGDSKQASARMQQFEKCAKAYPYPVEIQAERELIEIARKRKAAKDQAAGQITKTV